MLSAIERLAPEVRLARREIREGRFQRTMALVAAFSAVVSGFEAYAQHLRGAFRHWLMWTPVALAPPVVAAAVGALFSQRVARTALPVVSLAALVDGLVGFAFHVRGIGRLPGGFRLGQYNVVIGPPIFAPLLLGIVGVLGLYASLLRREIAHYPSGLAATLARIGRLTNLARDNLGVGLVPTPRRYQFGAWGQAPRLRAGPDWRTLVVSAVESRTRGELGSPVATLESEVAQGRFQPGMALTAGLLVALAGGEAYFEHLRGSFNQRLMWTPVWVSVPMLAIAIRATRRADVAERELPVAAAVTSLTGMLGFFLHLRGLHRMPGGLHSLSFGVIAGPPLFAPLLFTAVGLLGFIASLLRRAD